MGVEVPVEAVAQIVKSFDIDENGTLGFDEFMLFIKEVEKRM